MSYFKCPGFGLCSVLMNPVTDEMKQPFVGVMHDYAVAETVSEQCEWKQLCCDEERSEKWNTTVNFKRCIILKNEGYCTDSLLNKHFKVSSFTCPCYWTLKRITECSCGLMKQQDVGVMA